MVAMNRPGHTYDPRSTRTMIAQDARTAAIRHNPHDRKKHHDRQVSASL